MVLIAVTVCHFLPELFPDPYVFDPARYSEPRNEHRQPGAFAPFGLGGHPCAGAGLVEVLVMATVATLLHAVSLRLDPPDYVMRRVPNPFAEPEERFSVRVVAQRSPVATASAPRDAVDLSTAMPALSPALLSRVKARVRTLTYGPGEVIIRQGDPADRFYILAEGQVEVLQDHPDRGPQVLRRLEQGAYFGEIGLLHNVPRTATVRALSPVMLMALDRADFEEIVAESDLTAAEISAVVQRRMMSSRLAEALPALSPEQIASVALRADAPAGRRDDHPSGRSGRPLPSSPGARWRSSTTTRAARTSSSQRWGRATTSARSASCTTARAWPASVRSPRSR